MPLKKLSKQLPPQINAQKIPKIAGCPNTLLIFKVLDTHCSPLTNSSGFKKLRLPRKGAGSLKIVANDYFSDVFLTKFSFLDHSACQIKSVSDVIANATENPCWIWWHNFFPEKISQTIVTFGTIWTERFIFEIFVINYLVYCNLWAQPWIAIRLFYKFLETYHCFVPSIFKLKSVFTILICYGIIIQIAIWNNKNVIKYMGVLNIYCEKR